MKYLSIFFAFFIALTPFAEAQQASTRSDFSAAEQERLLENQYIMDFRKAAYESMMLTEEEIERFDPLYRNYMSRKMDILDERFRLMNNYRAGLNEDKQEQKSQDRDELTADFIENYWETKIDEMQLKKNYFDRFENVVSNADAITFFMLEEQLQSEMEEASLIEIVPVMIEVQESYIPMMKKYFDSSQQWQKKGSDKNHKKKKVDLGSDSSYDR